MRAWPGTTAPAAAPAVRGYRVAFLAFLALFDLPVFAPLRALRALSALPGLPEAARTAPVSTTSTRSDCAPGCAGALGRRRQHAAHTRAHGAGLRVAVTVRAACAARRPRHNDPLRLPTEPEITVP